jgi:8-oxo-dGTP pyrophosphatase MutT (NUDIX family)
MNIPANDLLQEGKDYCENCFTAGVQQILQDGRKGFICAACGRVSDRRISLSAPISWWITPDRALWHESAGIFIFNSDGKILFFELTKYPYGLTIPAGHCDRGEGFEDTVVRELREETGLLINSVQFLANADIEGDSCSRGADAHRWHVFTGHDTSTQISMDASEGVNAVWLTLEEVDTNKLTVPVRYFINAHRETLANLADAARV